MSSPLIGSPVWLRSMLAPFERSRCLPQHLGDFGKTGGLGILKRCRVIVDARSKARISPRGEQQPQCLEVTPACGVVERRPVVNTSPVQVGAVSDKQLHHLQPVMTTIG